MTIKELMAQVDTERVTDAFLLLDYCFSADDFENTFVEKFKAIPELREIIKKNVCSFAECTPNDDGQHYTIFVISMPGDAYENRWKKEIYAFAVCDEEVLGVIDKECHIFDSEGEYTVTHYGFSNLLIEKISNFRIAEASSEEFGKEICAAKILSEMFFWGYYPEQREKVVEELEKDLGKPIDKSQLYDSEDFDECMRELEEQYMADMSDDEKAYRCAEKRFEGETKEIVQRYQNGIYNEIQNQLIKAIKEEYKNR